MTIGTNDKRCRHLHIRRFVSYVTFHPATFTPAIKGPSTQRSAVSNAFVVLNVHKIIQSPQIAPANLEISPWYINRNISWRVSPIGLLSLMYSLISGELPTPRYSWLRIGARLIEFYAASVGLMLPMEEWCSPAPLSLDIPALSLSLPCSLSSPQRTVEQS